MDEDYKIYFSVSTINNYLKHLIKTQENSNKRKFFPSKDDEFKEYFSKISNQLDYTKIKYNNSNDLKKYSKIISYYGKSGFSYLENVEHVIYLNKPLLMFYGIEQLSAFFINLHFNQIDSFDNLGLVDDREEKKIKRKIRQHGIDSHEFNNIDINSSINDLLLKKIRLKNYGLCPRFFLIFHELYRKSLIYRFIDGTEISLLDLLKTFFFRENEYLTKRLITNFQENIGNDRFPSIQLNSTIYSEINNLASSRLLLSYHLDITLFQEAFFCF